MQSDEKRRTIRRYAHEMYPEPNEAQAGDLTAQMPYLYARAIGLRSFGTGFMDVPLDHMKRCVEFTDAVLIALLADAHFQGMTGPDAWEWAYWSQHDEMEAVWKRAMSHGVKPQLIKPYPCGPEPQTHWHKATTGDVTGDGIVTPIWCAESECPTCTEPTT